MKFGSLFSGIGGFDIGLERAGMECAWQVELDDYATKVLEKHWPNVKRYRDIREVGKQNLEAVDLICGGFPCQPFSVAGQQKGKEDNRYLWPDMLRVVSEVRPAWFIGENVAGIVNLALDQVLFDLEAEGYETKSFIIPACAVDAPHRRDRVWIVGYSEHNGSSKAEVGRSMHEPQEQTEQNQSIESEGAGAVSEDVANTENSIGRQDSQTPSRRTPQQPRGRTSGKAAGANGWFPEPNVGRVANGVPARVDRLKCLGNAVIPQIVEAIGRAIVEGKWSCMTL